MKQNPTPYERDRSGKWLLLLIPLVTAINLLLDCFSVRLLFPFSAYLPRILLENGRAEGGLPFPVAVTISAAVVLCYAGFWIARLLKDRFPAMRCVFVCYALDSAIYFITVLPTLAESGLRVTHVLELMIRGWILYTLYRADRVAKHPDRDLPPDPKKRKADTKVQAPVQTPPDEEDDEGIQW